METNFKLFEFIILIMIIGFTLLACGTVSNPSVFVGKWELESGYFPFDKVELFKDGTGIIDEVGSFSWKVVNNRFVITHTWFALACDYEVSGVKITLTTDDGDRGIFINKNKERNNSKNKFAGIWYGDIDNDRVELVIIGSTWTINTSIPWKWEGNLSFHIVDADATEKFNNYYHSNPVKTFDANGNPVDLSILPADVMIRGVYMERYGQDDEHMRNSDGSLRYVAIKKKVGLDGKHIKSAVMKMNEINGGPEITFMLDNEGSEIFHRLTSANIGRQLALLLNDRVITQATIQMPVREAVSLIGFGMDKKVSNISQSLRKAIVTYKDNTASLSLIKRRELGIEEQELESENISIENNVIGTAIISRSKLILTIKGETYIFNKK